MLKNKQNGCYARVKSSSMANGTNVVQYEYDGTKYEKWYLTYNSSSGYYTIRSKGASTAYYLTVKNSASTLNQQVVLGTNSSLSGAKWKIMITTSGACMLIPKCGEASGYCLATGTSNATNNINIVQGQYVQNTTYIDEWYLCNVIDGVPTYLTSTTLHSCIPCAITNIAGYYSTHNYSLFNCSTDSQQETHVVQVSDAMDTAAGSSSGHLANANIQAGFNHFTAESGSVTFSFNASNMWQYATHFTISDLISEISNNKPVMLGFAAGSPYSETVGHMTVCVGFELKNGKYYVTVSDAITHSYVEWVFDPQSYNDFISKISVVTSY